MQVTFKNTGMIKNADIRLDGLTIIAGKNDTGKSTVGKLLFAIIKTFNRYERDARLFQIRKLDQLIDHDYFDFRRKTTDPNALNMGKGFFEEFRSAVLGMIGSDTPKEEIQNSINDRIANFIDNFFRVTGIRMELDELSGKAMDILDKRPSKKEIFSDSFSKYLVSVLSGEPLNRFARDREYFLSGKEGGNILFKITGSNSQVAEIHLFDKLYFEDATFIESPIILNIANTIRFSKTEFDMTGELKKNVELLEQSYVPEYMRDLILKLTSQPARGKSSHIMDQIRQIIGGNFYYDKDERDFIFKKADHTFKGVSIASGIKSIGMIDILLQAGFISGKSLLVIDEPEAPLHPEWQVRFAELIVKVVAQGNNVLVASHSPYLIEALKLYSDREGLKDRTAFYLAEPEKTGYTSRIFEVSDDISPIFDILAEPFEKLELLQLRQKK
jgi:predicted ATPase